MDEAKVLEINSIQDHDNFFGVESRNPMISIIDVSKFDHLEYVPIRFGIYAIICYIDSDELNSENNIISAIGFYSPGQYSRFSSGRKNKPKGWILAIDTKLSEDTTLSNRIKELSYFSSHSSVLIHLNQEETNMISNCMLSLSKELDTPADNYTPHILRSGLSILMNICLRYYDNHNSTISDSRKNIMVRINSFLDNYLRRPSSDKDIPSVATVAKALGITPNYLGDVIRKHSSYSAHEYIRRFILREAQHQLQYSNISINNIAYNIGYKYPHHFTRVFKDIYGITPSEYRAKYRPQKGQKHQSTTTM